MNGGVLVQSTYTIDPSRCCNAFEVLFWTACHTFDPDPTPAKVRIYHDADGKIKPTLLRQDEDQCLLLKNWSMEHWSLQENRGRSKEGLCYNFTRGAEQVKMEATSPYITSWKDHKRENPYRIPLDVLYDCTPDGLLWPLKFYRAGNAYTIDELHKVGQGSNVEAGIQGVRYLCSIGDRILQLFLDGITWIVSKAELEFVLAGQIER